MPKKERIMSCILRMKELQKEFTGTEKKIAKYILENPSAVSKHNAASLGDICQASAASIIRFSKKIGYKGFSEFKIALAAEVGKMGSEEDEIYEAVKKQDTTKEIIQKIGQGNIQAIADTLQILDEEQIEKAIRELSEAKQIAIFGVGASGLVAQDFAHKLMRIGKNVVIYSDSHSQLAAAVHLKTGDVAFGISHSGKSLETHKCLQKAKENGATVISLTKYGHNPISQLADIPIYVAGEEKNLRTAAIVSRIAQLTVIDILFIGIAKQDFSHISEVIQSTRLMVEPFKL
ncbi:MAG: MurR/RpiR family transcriptional regulator [Schleiferiaceae bacterium]|jgi:DNA-binding MurR/RpiR family transcriptional regulator|nr:MurR/RpiR family transcriptional regulator [Schleiferiaceae bacterium]